MNVVDHLAQSIRILRTSHAIKACLIDDHPKAALMLSYLLGIGDILAVVLAGILKGLRFCIEDLLHIVYYRL